MNDFLPLSGEFLDEYNAKQAEVIQAYECSHIGLAENRRRILKNGAVHIQQQCVGCGAFIKAVQKNLFSVAEVEAMPLWDDELPDQRWRDKQDLLNRWRKYIYSQQQRAKAQQARQYDQYIKYSPEWKRKTALVMKRSNGICEGCGERKATQVHHITYEHLYNEFLWELRAVCGECHERVHGIGNSEIA